MSLSPKDFREAIGEASVADENVRCLVYADGSLKGITPAGCDGWVLWMSHNMVFSAGGDGRGATFPPPRPGKEPDMEWRERMSRELFQAAWNVHQQYQKSRSHVHQGNGNGNGNGKPDLSPSGLPILRIGRKGMMACALGDGEPFEFDVVLTHDKWWEIRRGLENDKGEIPPENNAALNQAAYQFVAEVSNTQELTATEVWEFLRIVADKTKELSAFFVPKSKSEPSSPGSTELTFST